MKIPRSLKFLAAVCFLTIHARPAFCQSKVYVALDFRHTLAFSEISSSGYKISDLSERYGNSLRLTAMCRISPRVAAGVGFGSELYEPFNSFPVFATVYYSPLKTHLPAYLYSNAGYAIDTSNSAEGYLFDLGVGYKKMFRRHFGLNFQMGYNFKQFGSPSDYHFSRHSFSFGFGFIF